MPPSHIQIWGLSSAHFDFGKSIRKSKTMVQFLRKVSYSDQKERTAYTKDKAALNVILSNCTRPRTFSR